MPGYDGERGNGPSQRPEAVAAPLIPRQSARSIRSKPLPDLAQAVVGHGAPVVVVTGTVVAVVVVVAGTVVVVAGTVVVVVATLVVVGGLVVVVDRGSVARVVVVAPRVVAVVATVLFVVAVVVGSLVVVTTTVPRGTVGAVVTVVPLTSALKNAVRRPEPRTANVVVVDLGEVAADAPGDAARGAATTDVGTGTNGTPVALSARTGASVGACG